MVSPIVLYGNTILRKETQAVDPASVYAIPLITKLWNTLYATEGVGLAAPQINENYKAFVIDSSIVYNELSDEERKEYFPEDNGVKELFINPKIIEKSAANWSDYEGCLSIPGISETISRSWKITIEYLDAKFENQVKTFSGYTAKVIQHEYDHLHGTLFIDHLPALKRKLLFGKLKSIKNGKITTDYQSIL